MKIGCAIDKKKNLKSDKLWLAAWPDSNINLLLEKNVADAYFWVKGGGRRSHVVERF